MSYSREGRSVSPGRRRQPRSGRSRSRSRSRESQDASNPGNNLYVTGLSTRVTAGDLEKYFGNEGKVLDCHLVTDPHTKESRGFAFVTMETVEGAERCIKYLNRSVLEGRLITVEKVLYVLASSKTKLLTVQPVPSHDMSSASTFQTHGFKLTILQKAKRSRGRTPTPGRYQGVRDRRGQGHRRSRSYSPRQNDRDYHSRGRRGRSRSRSPYGRGRDDRDLHRRRRERSLSGDGGGHRR